MRLRSPWLFLFPMILVGLLLWMQVSLIRDSFRAHSESFDREVQLRLSEMAEQAESGYFVFQTQATQTIPSYMDFFWLYPTPQGLDTVITQHPTIPLYQFNRFRFPVDVQVKTQIQFEYLPIDTIPADSVARLVAGRAQNEYRNYVLDEDGKRLFDTLRIDSLAREFLAETVGDAPFALAVYDTSLTDSLIWAQSNFEQLATAGSRYRSKLYPSSFMPQLTLAVALPASSGFFWQRQWPIVAGALALVLLLAVLLVIAIRTIRRQQRLSDLKTDLIHTMTHEFNTPVTNIRLAASQYDPKMSPERRQELLTIVLNENERIGTNIKKILEARNLDAPTLKVHPKRVGLSELIRQVASAFEPQLEEHQMNLKVDQQVTSDTVWLDEEHFLNVLANLLDNAIKFSPPGKPITIFANGSANELRIAVEDQGFGLESGQQKHIFDQFYRGEATRSNRDGFGIGLYYVKKIMALHGGRIEVVSQPGKGSTFTLFFPQPNKR